MRDRLHVTIAPGMLGKIDRAAKSASKTRSGWVEDACVAEMEREPDVWCPTKCGNFGAMFFPYTLWTDGEGTWRVLSRRYHDPGCVDRITNLADRQRPFEPIRNPKGRSALDLLERLAWNGHVRESHGGYQCWLYGSSPWLNSEDWADYTERLRELCRLDLRVGDEYLPETGERRT